MDHFGVQTIMSAIEDYINTRGKSLRHISFRSCWWGFGTRRFLVLWKVAPQRKRFPALRAEVGLFVRMRLQWNNPLNSYLKMKIHNKYCPGWAVARLTRFEGRGHKKASKGPPFAYVFWKNFQRVPPLLMFFWKKFKNKLSKGGVLAFSHLPFDFTGGPWPPAPPPPKCATVDECFHRFVCTWTCARRLDLSANCFLHCSHWNGFSPVCVRKWPWRKIIKKMSQSEMEWIQWRTTAIAKRRRSMLPVKATAGWSVFDSADTRSSASAFVGAKAGKLLRLG